VTSSHFGFDWYGIGPWEIVGGILSFLFSSAVFILFIAVVVKLLRDRPLRVGGNSSSGLQVLEERYARGEITREEFLERRAVLSGDSTAPPA
jgi:putative membrane protein